MTRRRCPYCWWKDEETGKRYYYYGVETDWRPGLGHDPRLRLWRCVCCGREWYEPLKEAEALKEIVAMKGLQCRQTEFLP